MIVVLLALLAIVSHGLRFRQSSGAATVEAAPVEATETADSTADTTAPAADTTADAATPAADEAAAPAEEAAAPADDAATNYVSVPDFTGMTPSQEILDATFNMTAHGGVNNTHDYIDLKDPSYQVGTIDSLFLNQLSISKHSRLI